VLPALRWHSTVGSSPTDQIDLPRRGESRDAKPVVILSTTAENSADPCGSAPTGGGPDQARGLRERGDVAPCLFRGRRAREGGGPFDPRWTT